MHHRLRRFESLEPRRLLTAAYINELLFKPLFGNPDTDQYVELRGEPHAVLDSGTYLVVVESAKSLSNLEGQIHGIFDLSELAFGDNGFLVLQPQDSPFTSDPLATTLQSAEPGFGGLPGDRYSDSHELSERIDFIYDSNTFFLIQTDVAPRLGDDIDTNSDGYIDDAGVFDAWNVLDSVSTLWGLGDGYGYGEIVLVDSASFDPAVTVAEGATRVDLEGTGYVARIGNSTGSTADDWLGGLVKDMSDDDLSMRLAGDVHGRPRPIVFHGRELDSLGSENFTAAFRAHLFEDLDGDGQRGPDESPLTGISLLADSNGNGVRDLLTTVIEPDDFAEEVELNNLTKGVTLSTAIEENVVIGFDIEAKQDFWSPEGFHNFAHSGIDFFNTTRRLRMDFYRPAESVSIDVIGNSNSIPTYGRLEVFDAQGNSLRMVRTGPLGDNARQRLTIDMGDDVIAYAVAYPDDEYLDSSQYGQLDSIAFTVPEAIATTDADGVATLNYLDPGDYAIVGLPGSAEDPYLMDPLSIHVDRYENFLFSVPAVKNESPIFTSDEFSVAELSPGGTVVGNVVARDAPGQAVLYTLVAGQNRFVIDAVSGQLRVKNDALLNYEDLATYTVRVRASDDAAFPLSSESDFVIRVADVNEQPSGGPQSFEIAENPPAGAVIGSVVANDPDAGVWGLAGYRISDSDPNRLAFAIDPQTGQLSVNDPTTFDFESNRSLTVTVVADDGGTPSLSGAITVTVHLADQNEPPRVVAVAGEIETGEIMAGESWEHRFPADLFSDADAEQSLGLTVVGSDGALPEWLHFDPQTAVLTGAPWNADQGEHQLVLRATDNGTPPLSSELAFTVRVVANGAPWHNHQQPVDVSGDGGVQPIDALIVINYLNRGNSSEVPLNVRLRPAYLDVNGNNRIEPLDALMVINRLNRAIDGEGERTGGSGETGGGFFADRGVEDERLRRLRIADAALLEFVRARELG